MSCVGVTIGYRVLVRVWDIVPRCVFESFHTLLTQGIRMQRLWTDV